ncbi:MAG: GtrA family protein [Candidatus Saccharimonadaceae bacterium]
MEKLQKKHAEKIRYIFVGGFNTFVDFVLLFTFVAFGVDKILANYFSTGVSMIVSFFINKSFTFKDTSEKKKRQFVLFISVTVVGMWVIQPLVIWIVTSVLHPHLPNQTIQLFIAKLIATGASLVWNYMLYSRVVFKNNSTNSA